MPEITRFQEAGPGPVEPFSQRTENAATSGDFSELIFGPLGDRIVGPNPFGILKSANTLGNDEFKPVIIAARFRRVGIRTQFDRIANQIARLLPKALFPLLRRQ